MKVPDSLRWPKRLLLGLNPIKFFLGTLSVGLAIAFPHYFDRWVFFPLFPNVLDALTMFGVGLLLLYEVVLDVRKKLACGEQHGRA